jgi:hypothetical protein
MYPADGRDSNLIADSPPQHSELLYFPVGLIKFAVLSICTFGLYEFYWFYKNWQFVKEQEHSDMMPFWRAFFVFFFCYSLFRRIGQSAQEAGLPSISAGVLAAGWIIVKLLLHRLPDPYSLVSFFAFVFLMPIQQTVNKINAKYAPSHDPSSRFRAWNILAVVVGGIFFVLAIIGSFLSPE